MNKKVCLILAAVAAVTGAMADEVDRSNVKVRIGMGPSHIIGSPDPIFAGRLDGWEKNRGSHRLLLRLVRRVGLFHENGRCLFHGYPGGHCAGT